MRDGKAISGATATTYRLVAADVNAKITCVVIAEGLDGTLTSNEVGPIEKAEQKAPSAPVVSKQTTTSVTVKVVKGCEYSIDGGKTWQTSGEFKNLKSNVSYTIIARMAETATHKASPVSEALKVSLTCEAHVPAANCPSKPFKDIDYKEWYHLDVDYCVATGLMNGMSSSVFAPQGTTTRAQIVTILYRLSGEKVTSSQMKAMKFKDVAANEWYAEAVAWAASTGVVKGVSETSYAPNVSITREQIATMMYRFAKYKGIDTSARANLSKFPDKASVSDWAYDAVCWANASGLLNGNIVNNKTIIQPQGVTTRAQASAFIHRFCLHIGR